MSWWHWVLLWLVVACLIAPLIGKFIKAGRGPWLLVLVLLPSPAVAQDGPPAPKWAVALAASGPLADGISTAWAMHQSGPHARVGEGNSVYRKLFGADVTGGEILAAKIAQAAVWGAVIHYAGKQNRKAAIGVAIATAAIHFTVSALNVRNGMRARELNRGTR